MEVGKFPLPVLKFHFHTCPVVICLAKIPKLTLSDVESLFWCL